MYDNSSLVQKCLRTGTKVLALLVQKYLLTDTKRTRKHCLPPRTTLPLAVPLLPVHRLLQLLQLLPLLPLLPAADVYSENGTCAFF
jgi:hypothetical protein